jgi:hypothetical protein
MNAAVTQEANPVDTFSDCHAGILAGLRTFSTLPPLSDAARRARDVAAQMMEMMDKAVLEHHKEEEEALFPAVLKSAEEGAEKDAVRTLVWRLTDEHREVEALWKTLRPDVARIAQGKPVTLRQEMVDVLVSAYRHHAQTEERQFLPLAQEILKRNGNHMAALGLSMHLRHARVPISYI